MDGFPCMPGEIVRLIGIEAVRARGVKRAVRLRLVNGSWNREITEAIVESGILNGHQKVAESCLWPKLLMHKIRLGDNLPSRKLRLIYRAAQRVVAFRAGKSGSENPEALQAYLWDICQLSPEASVYGPRRMHGFFMPDEHVTPIHDSDDDFRETLLAVAAATNDLALVQELLPSMQDFPHLVYQNGRKQHIPVLGYPMDIAAFQGHVEVLRTMLDIEKHPVCLRFALQDGVSFGNAGNQVGSLDACLDSAYNGYQRGLVGILERTRTIPLFDRLYQVCKDHLTNGHRNPWEPELDKRQIQVEFLSGHFHRAALDGKLALMNHLVQLGSRRTHVDRVVDNKNGYRELVSRVAEKGYADVLTYLLENRAKIGSRSLEAACDHGNPDTVRILLEYGARDSWKPGNALLKAAERENETALRLLLETGTLIDKDQKQQVLNFAKEEGLSSMVKILEEYR